MVSKQKDNLLLYCGERPELIFYVFYCKAYEQSFNIFFLISKQAGRFTVIETVLNIFSTRNKVTVKKEIIYEPD